MTGKAQWRIGHILLVSLLLSRGMDLEAIARSFAQRFPGLKIGADSKSIEYCRDQKLLRGRYVANLVYLGYALYELPYIS